MQAFTEAKKGQQRRYKEGKFHVQDAEGHNLWEMTWHRAYGVSSGLTPNLLIPSEVAVKPTSPVRGPESGQQQEQLPGSSSMVAGPSSPLATPNAASPPADPMPGSPQTSPQATSAPAVPPLEAPQAGTQPLPMALSASREQEPSLQAEVPPAVQQQSEALPEEISESRREPAGDLSQLGSDGRTGSPQAGESKLLAATLPYNHRSTQHI